MDDSEQHEVTDHDDVLEMGQGFEELLSYLGESRGFDFSGYKRAGLARRLTKRLVGLGLNTFQEYLDYLQVHPGEFGHLFNSVLINATSFFRDPIAWEYIAEQVIPRLIAAKQGGPIRVWSAGCATGQEAYSVAMLLAEALGLDAYNRRVKIYATDIDDEALAQARRAIYTQKDLAGVPATLLDKYFEPINDKSAFIKDLRRSVIFGRHNLFCDAAISRIDLLLCRNTLMYFNADAQARILSSLHFALSDEGVLFLGKAEMLFTHSALFSPLDLKRRIFCKITHPYPRPRSVPSAAVGRSEQRASRGEGPHMREAAFEASPVPQLVIDTHGCLAVVNDQARRVLGVLASEIGKPIRELGLYRKVERLREGIEQANAEGRPVQLAASEWLRGHGDDPRSFDVLASPLVDETGVSQGVQLSFLDVTASRKLQDELQQATHELEGAYEELQATSEELETTNEELQSTVEELETTNEELQSTNEELETTNEELQSTNEELQTMNEELRTRSGELGRVNLYFESILASLRSAVIVLDLELKVEVWSDRAQELWGLRTDEVRGKHFLSLDIGLPSQLLMGRIRACVAQDTDTATDTDTDTGASTDKDHEQISVAATNRRGRSIQCEVLISRLTQEGKACGVILLMDEHVSEPRPESLEHDA